MDKIIQTIHESLVKYGFYYDSNFYFNDSSFAQQKDFFTTFARKFGSLYLEEESVIQTNPHPSAPPWLPFDRAAQIGWHNDFSTKKVRPRISISWIVNQDPQGVLNGGWRLVSVRDLINVIRNRDDGLEILARLAQPVFPFGYLDSGTVTLFPIYENTCGEQMRFYGRALQEGVEIQENQVTKSEVLEIIKIIEEAADIVGIVKSAPKGALMIVDNTRSLHDRLQQTVDGNQPLRTALLGFVI